MYGSTLAVGAASPLLQQPSTGSGKLLAATRRGAVGVLTLLAAGAVLLSSQGAAPGMGLRSVKQSGGYSATTRCAATPYLTVQVVSFTEEEAQSYSVAMASSAARTPISVSQPYCDVPFAQPAADPPVPYSYKASFDSDGGAGALFALQSADSVSPAPWAPDLLLKVPNGGSADVLAVEGRAPGGSESWGQAVWIKVCPDDPQAPGAYAGPIVGIIKSRVPTAASSPCGTTASAVAPAAAAPPLATATGGKLEGVSASIPAAAGEEENMDDMMQRLSEAPPAAVLGAAGPASVVTVAAQVPTTTGAPVMSDAASEAVLQSAHEIVPQSVIDSALATLNAKIKAKVAEYQQAKFTKSAGKVAAELQELKDAIGPLRPRWEPMKAIADKKAMLESKNAEFMAMTSAVPHVENPREETLKHELIALKVGLNNLMQGKQGTKQVITLLGLAPEADFEAEVPVEPASREEPVVQHSEDASAVAPEASEASSDLLGQWNAAVSSPSAADVPAGDSSGELTALRASQLRKRAVSDGLSQDEIDKADDGEAPKAELVKLVAAAEAKKNADGLKQHTDDLKRHEMAQLQNMHVSELRKRARAAGIDQSQLDAADDSGSPREALIDLIVNPEEPADTVEEIAEAGAGPLPAPGPFGLDPVFSMSGAEKAAARAMLQQQIQAKLSEYKTATDHAVALRLKEELKDMKEQLKPLSSNWSPDAAMEQKRQQIRVKQDRYDMAPSAELAAELDMMKSSLEAMAPVPVAAVMEPVADVTPYTPPHQDGDPYASADEPEFVEDPSDEGAEYDNDDPINSEVPADTAVSFGLNQTEDLKDRVAAKFAEYEARKETEEGPRLAKELISLKEQVGPLTPHWLAFKQTIESQSGAMEESPSSMSSNVADAQNEVERIEAKFAQASAIASEAEPTTAVVLEHCCEVAEPGCPVCTTQQASVQHELIAAGQPAEAVEAIIIPADAGLSGKQFSRARAYIQDQVKMKMAEYQQTKGTPGGQEAATALVTLKSYLPMLMSGTGSEPITLVPGTASAVAVSDQAPSDTPFGVNFAAESGSALPAMKDVWASLPVESTTAAPSAMPLAEKIKLLGARMAGRTMPGDSSAGPALASMWAGASNMQQAAADLDDLSVATNPVSAEKVDGLDLIVPPQNEKESSTAEVSSAEQLVTPYDSDKTKMGDVGKQAKSEAINDDEAAYIRRATGKKVVDRYGGLPKPITAVALDAGSHAVVQGVFEAYGEALRRGQNAEAVIAAAGGDEAADHAAAQRSRELLREKISAKLSEYQMAKNDKTGAQFRVAGELMAMKKALAALGRGGDAAAAAGDMTPAETGKHVKKVAMPDAPLDEMEPPMPPARMQHQVSKAATAELERMLSSVQKSSRVYSNSGKRATLTKRISAKLAKLKLEKAMGGRGEQATRTELAALEAS